MSKSIHVNYEIDDKNTRIKLLYIKGSVYGQVDRNLLFCFSYINFGALIILKNFIYIYLKFRF